MNKWKRVHETSSTQAYKFVREASTVQSERKQKKIGRTQLDMD